MIPRLKPYLNHKELLAVLRPKKNAKKIFENKFAQKFDCKYGIFFRYGRTALYAFLKANKIENKEIIMPAYTCIVVAESIVHSRNRPIFVDCAENDFNMDLELAKKKINKNTKVIIATSIFGVPMNYKKLYEIVREKEKQFGNKIFIVQDCAHSFGAEYDNEMLCSKGDIAIFGLNISKLITTVVGGMMTTNDEKQYKLIKKFNKDNLKSIGTIKKFRSLSYFLATYPTFNQHIYTMINWLERKKLISRFTEYYDSEKIQMPDDFFEDVPEFFFKIGLVQLTKYDEIVEHRRKISDLYSRELRGLDIKIPEQPSGATISHYTILVKDRDALLKKAIDNGIQLGWLIEYSIPLLKAYKNYSDSIFPVSQYYSEHAVNLPVHISIKMAGKIINFLHKVLK